MSGNLSRSRLIIGLILILVAAAMLFLGEGSFATAGAIALGVLGLTSIAISRKGGTS